MYRGPRPRGKGFQDLTRERLKMSEPKAKPGRRKGPPGRNKIAAAHKELAALTPEQRKGLHYNGIGPGDSYVGTWVLLNFYRRKLTHTLKALTNEKTSPAARLEHNEIQRWCLDHIEGLYKMLLPHEKARLQSITLTGDPSTPVYHEVDLKGLPTEDLKALATERHRGR
jgi:hypothetical protein